MTKPAYESKWQFQQKYVQQNCATGAGTGDFLQSVISQNKVLKKERKRGKEKEKRNVERASVWCGYCTRRWKCSRAKNLLSTKRLARCGSAQVAHANDGHYSFASSKPWRLPTLEGADV